MPSLDLIVGEILWSRFLVDRDGVINRVTGGCGCPWIVRAFVLEEIREECAIAYADAGVEPTSSQDSISTPIGPAVLSRA